MNKYEEVGIAGEGTYGVVLKCRDKSSGNLVAIKRFRESKEDDEDDAKCKQREVKLLQALKHENIIKLLEAFKRKDTLHLVFEYLPLSLWDVLQANPGGVAATTVWTLTRHLARALQHCHESNVVHRDIKPENLMVDLGTPVLKLCDFGSARKLGTKTDTGPLTDYVATRWYRAPELLLSFNRYNKSVDMWSFGCVMAELTDGKPLFAGTSDLDQLCTIQKAIGPLTSDQSRRYMELSDFCGVKCPTTNTPGAVFRQRFGTSMSVPQLQVLQAIIKMEPSHRLTAKAALCSTWLRADGAAAAPAQFRQLKKRENISPPPSEVSSRPATPSVASSEGGSGTSRPASPGHPSPDLAKPCTPPVWQGSRPRAQMIARATPCLTRSGTSGLEAVAPMLPLRRTSRPPSSSTPQLSRPASGSRSTLSQLQPEGSTRILAGPVSMVMAQHRSVRSLSPWPSRPSTPASQATSGPTSGRPAAAVPCSAQAVQRQPVQPQSQQRRQQQQKQLLQLKRQLSHVVKYRLTCRCWTT
mmetsp:Transcript_28933/g.56589  ORF Transcript_28933/g.56589 Transcript_28933/m.56589 type:complete len:526 (-) Transcript_28933:176-1753(-)